MMKALEFERQAAIMKETTAVTSAVTSISSESASETSESESKSKCKANIKPREANIKADTAKPPVVGLGVTVTPNSKAARRPFVALPNSVFSDSLRQALSPTSSAPMERPQQSSSSAEPVSPGYPSSSILNSNSSSSSSSHFLPMTLNVSISGEEIWKPSDSSDSSNSRESFLSKFGSSLLGGWRKQSSKTRNEKHKGGYGNIGDAYNTDGCDEYDEDDEEDSDFFAYREDGQVKIGKRSRFQGGISARCGWSILTLLALGAIALGVLATVITISAVNFHYSASDAEGSGYRGPSDYDATVILVSLDGFRSEYFTRGFTPNLAALATSGVRAEYLKPVFPSVTFPNHYTIVTGLYPESHGIVGNVFYDPVLNDTFVYVDSKKNGENKWWDGEPIWVTAVKQGQRSATCMWPGSEAPITKDQIRPTYWLPFDYKMTPDAKVKQVFSWLDLPRHERPSMITLYAPEVDSAGHAYGPDSSQVDNALRRVDLMIGSLMDGIKARGLTSKVNLVVVSDHGMTKVHDYLFLDDWIDLSKIRLWNNLLITIEPVHSKDYEEIIANLTIASKATGHFEVWKKGEERKPYHFSNNSRIGSIIVLPNLGYFITTREAFAQGGGIPIGMHGYDNDAEDMRAIFIASGPAFAENSTLVRSASLMGLEIANKSTSLLDISSPASIYHHAGLAVGGYDGGYLQELVVDMVEQSHVSSSRVRKPNSDNSPPQRRNSNDLSTSYFRTIPAFDNVEIYNLLAVILGLTSAPNNGTIDWISKLLIQ